MRTFGLIGHPLAHSFSQRYFTEKFEKEAINDAQYQLFPIEKIELLTDLVKSTPHLAGLNVTIPYKESVIPFLDKIDPLAEEIGAVNVIKLKNNQLIGYNSDAHGFEQSLQNWLDGLGKKLPAIALVLGTGGAAKCVVHTLKSLGTEAYYVSRNQAARCFSYDDLDFFLKTQKTPALLINTTPLGTFPNVEEKPNFDYKRLKSNILVYDLVYNPSETAFMQAAKKQGCETKNGLEMLELQAEKAWEIWNNNKK